MMTTNPNGLVPSVSTAIFLQAAPAGLLPFRIMAAIALAAVIFVFIWILRHLRKIEKTIVEDNLVPTERGPRNNMILMACAITLIIVSLLLFLIIKA
jgi:ABC-type Fe3+ transport system permease subunit